MLIVPMFLRSGSTAECTKENKGNLRIAFDIGSGNTKMQSAWIDPKNHTIIKLIETKKVAIPLGETLKASKNKEIPEELIQMIIQTIQDFKQENAIENVALQCLGTATEGMRSAQNGQSTLNKIANETGVPLFFLSQNEEAAQGHLTLYAEGITNKMSNSSYIVWENGNGSCQISTKDKQGKLHTFNHQMGKIFAKDCLEKAQNKNVLIKKKQINEIILQIQGQLAPTPPWLSNKLKQEDITIIGLGAMFSSPKKGLNKKIFSKKEIADLIDLSVEQQNHNKELKVNKPTFLSDLLFLYAIMDFLGIEQLYIPKVKGQGSTSGLLIDPSKWTT